MDDDTTPVKPDAVQTPAGDDPLASLLGGLDMGSLLSMAGEMQQQMAEAQDRAEKTEVEGSAGGGAVRVTMTGTFECTGVVIAPDATQDVALLEDMVLAALRDALGKARAIADDGPLGGLGGLLGG